MPRAHRSLQVALLVVTLLTAMDQTIVATALPSIVTELGGAEGMGWVFAGYTLAMTVGMPVYGRLSDIVGRRGLFLGSLVAFVVASAACGLAQTMTELVALRGLQGLAGGGVLVLSQAVVADVVGARDRGAFMAPVGLVFALATVVAPLVGGVLTDTVGWRWVFWVNLPLGTLAVALAVRSVPSVEVARSKGRLDVVGAVLYGAAVTGVVALAGLAGSGHTWLAPATVAVSGMTVISCVLFVRRMLRHHDPLIPVGVLRNRTVALASGLGFVNGSAVFALVGFVPTLVQQHLGLPATQSGVLLLPLVLGMMLSVTSTARWTRRTGHYRRLPLIGCGISLMALLMLTGFDRGYGVPLTALCIALLGLGVGCFLQLITTMAQDAAPAGMIGSATSTVSLVRELGVTVGAAAIGRALAASVSASALFTALAVVMAAGCAMSLLLPDRRLSERALGQPA